VLLDQIAEHLAQRPIAVLREACDLLQNGRVPLLSMFHQGKKEVFGSHGVVETPCLVPVATQAVIKTLTSEEVEKTKSQILICNTYYLYLKLKDLHQLCLKQK
jgi:hypothetical protein